MNLPGPSGDRPLFQQTSLKPRPSSTWTAMDSHPDLSVSQTLAGSVPYFGNSSAYSSISLKNSRGSDGGNCSTGSMSALVILSRRNILGALRK